jgi:hypothetical protein
MTLSRGVGLVILIIVVLVVLAYCGHLHGSVSL